LTEIKKLNQMKRAWLGKHKSPGPKKSSMSSMGIEVQIF
jgi:hypothetical protein